MTRASSGTWALPTNSFRPAVAATAINPTDWNAVYADIELGFNEGIYGCLSADYTLSDVNTAQKAFNIGSGSGGTFAVVASTTYLVDGLFLITNTGTTSHTWAISFALTTATFTSAMIRARGRTGATGATTFTADLSAYTTDPTTALVCTAASTANPEHVIIDFSGVFRVGTAGTITPKVTASAAPTGTEKMLKNSFIRLRPIGGDTVTSIGTWT